MLNHIFHTNPQLHGSGGWDKGSVFWRPAGLLLLRGLGVDFFFSLVVEQELVLQSAVKTIQWGRSFNSSMILSLDLCYTCIFWCSQLSAVLWASV